MRQMNKDILKLAAPSILANITVPLVGMVDIAVAGHLGPGAMGMTGAEGLAVPVSGVGAAALIGGISIGSMLFDLLYWNFGFLRVGTGGMTAQAYGRGDWKGSAGILGKGVGLALLIALAVLLIQWPFAKLVLLFVQASPRVLELALTYFFIRIWAAPATLTLMSLKGWFIGMQDTVSSMFTDLIVNGVNIAASILLSIGIPGTAFTGFGFVGIPLGTVLAQYSGFIFSLAVVHFKYGKITHGALHPRAVAASFRDGNMREFATVNGDLFIRSVALIVVYLSFTILSARYGDLLLAAASIMMQLLMIFSYFTDGFAFAGEALTGRFIGAGKPVCVRQAVTWTFVWSMGIGLFFVGIYAATGVPLLRLMTSDAAVVEVSKVFLPWLVVMPLIGCPAFTWDGIYTGATATKALRNASVGSVVAFYAVWFAGTCLLRWCGPAPDPAAAGGAAGSCTALHILFAAYFAHLIFRSLYQTFAYRKAILTRNA